MIGVTIALAAGLLAVSGASAGAPSVTMIGEPPYGGGPNIDLPLAITKAIDTAARTGQANWGLRGTLTYVSVNNDVQILAFGPLSVKNDTSFVGSIDSQTDVIKLTLAFGSLPPPGQNPSFSLDAQLLNPGS